MGKALNKEKVNERLFELFNGEFEIVGEYKGYHEDVLVIHKECGREFMCNLPSLIRRGNCKHCAKKKAVKGRTKTTETFKKEVYDLVNTEYEVIGEYVGVRKPILMKHLKCGQQYPQRPNDFLSGCRCPFCSTPTKSKYAKRVEEWLEEKGIQYIKEKTFDDCRGLKNKLPFDYYLPNHNILIEVDGEQHFNEDCFNQTKEQFQQLKRTEEIKNNYCLENGIILVRLPYYDYDKYIEILNITIKANTEVTKESKESLAP